MKVTKETLHSQLQLLNSLSEDTKYLLSFANGGTRVCSVLGSRSWSMELPRGTKKEAYYQLRAMVFALYSA